MLSQVGVWEGFPISHLAFLDNLSDESSGAEQPQTGH